MRTVVAKKWKTNSDDTEGKDFILKDFPNNATLFIVFHAPVFPFLYTSV